MYWFIYLDGKKLPTPYLNLEQVDEAMNELHEKLGPCILSCVYE